MVVKVAGKLQMDEAAARTRFEIALETYEQEFGSFFVVRLLGLEISYPDDFCLVTFPVHDFLFNPQGSYHGGMLATIMDISVGHLIKYKLGIAGLTLELKSQFMRPLINGPGRCEGRFIRQGRSVSFLESRLWDGNEKLVAHSTSTWKMIKEVTE